MTEKMRLAGKKIPGLVDIGVVAVFCFAAFFIGKYGIADVIIWRMFVISTFVSVLMLKFSDGYALRFERNGFSLGKNIWSVTMGVLFSLVILQSIFYVIPSWRKAEIFFRLVMFCSSIWIGLCIIRWIEFSLPHYGRKILIFLLSEDEIANHILRDVCKEIDERWYIYRLINDHFESVHWRVQDTNLDDEVICAYENNDSLNLERLKNVIEVKNYIPIVVTDQTVRLDDRITRFLVFCYRNGYSFVKASDLYELVCQKSPVFLIRGEWYWEFSYLRLSRERMFIKRAFDVCLACFLIPLLVIPAVLIGIIIKVESKGPVLFAQERSGFRQKLFRLFKFRTMLPHPDDSEEWPKVEENLITPFGRILRKTGLDEIPQLVNVLKGEMSFVGPRPARVKVAEMHCREIPFFAVSHAVLPGITGWSQVNQGQDSGYDSVLERVRYNLYYVKHSSILLDCFIIVRTMKMILSLAKPGQTRAVSRGSKGGQ